MLDEMSRRNEKFDRENSVPLKLADGQFWLFPKPWLQLRPVFREGRVVSKYTVLTYGTEVDALIDQIADAESGVDHICAVASLAAYLLKWHYDLTDRDLDSLLAFRDGDEDSMKWLQQVMEIATGSNGPKVSRAGGD